MSQKARVQLHGCEKLSDGAPWHNGESFGIGAWSLQSKCRIDRVVEKTMLTRII